MRRVRRARSYCDGTRRDVSTRSVDGMSARRDARRRDVENARAPRGRGDAKRRPGRATATARATARATAPTRATTKIENLEFERRRVVTQDAMGVGRGDDDGATSDDESLARAASEARSAADACADASARAIERARATVETHARRRAASDARAATLERERDALRAECERLRERLGREIVARGALEDGLDAPTTEALRGECELYREATRKYRKRAEHYEALYRAARRGVGAEGGDVAREAREGAKLRPRAFERARSEEERVRKFKRAARDDGAREGAEDALWGAGTTRKPSTRGAFVDVVPASPSSRDDEDARGRARARKGAPPLDRIFLDSKNTRAARRDSTTSSENKVRKNKRLSDNAPKSPDAVFEAADADAAARKEKRSVVKCVEVVRKKRERELLTSYVCEDCQTFYDAMMPNKDRATIKCTHAPKMNGIGGDAPSNSRHRAKWAPEPAPKGFWNLAFTPPERDG